MKALLSCLDWKVFLMERNLDVLYTNDVCPVFIGNCTCYVIPCIQKGVSTMIVNTVDAHNVSLHMQSIQMCDEKYYLF